MASPSPSTSSSYVPTTSTSAFSSSSSQVYTSASSQSSSSSTSPSFQYQPQSHSSSSSYQSQSSPHIPTKSSLSSNPSSSSPSPSSSSLSSPAAPTSATSPPPFGAPGSASAESLEVGVGIWERAPKHEITCIQLTGDASQLITGSTTGPICLWALSPHPDAPPAERLRPRMMLFGVHSSIVALALASRPPVDGFTSLAADGSLHVWDLQDGSCVASAPRLFDTLRQPTVMIGLPNKRHIAVSGRNSEISIVDVYTFQVVRRIRDHEDWVSDLYSCTLGGSEYHPFLVSLAVDGTARFSSLHNLSEENEGAIRTYRLPRDEEGDEGEGYGISPSGQQSLLAICVAPNAKTLVIVNTTSWMLFTANNHRLLFSVGCPKPCGWKGASYVDNLQVLVWAQDGTSYLYALPRAVDLLDSLHIPLSAARKARAQAQAATRRSLPVSSRMPSAPAFLSSPSSPFHNIATSAISEFRTHLFSNPSMSGVTHGPTGTPPSVGGHAYSYSASSASAIATTASSKVGSGASTPNINVESTGAPTSQRSSITSSGSSISTTNPMSSSATLSGSGHTGDWRITTDSSADDLAASHHDVFQTEEVDNEPPIEAEPSSLLDDISLSFPTIKHIFPPPSSPSADSSRSNCTPTKPGLQAAVGCWGDILVSSGGDGVVSLWRLPHALLVEDPELDGSINRGDFTAWATAQLADGFNFPKPPPRKRSTASSAEIPPPTNRLVTASLVVEEKLLLVRGFDNGDITITRLPAGEGTDDVIPRAHSSRINALITYYNGSRRYLVSAGQDCAIKVWDLNSRELVHIFTHHSGAVQQLFQPPKTSYGGRTGFTDSVFISVSADKTVGLFNLETLTCVHIFGGHPAQISNIGWKLEQDYLIVACDDGSVSIWELSTGLLESCVYGHVAAEILSTTKEVRTYAGSKNKALSAFSIKSCVDDAPLQVMMLNIKELVNSLYARMGTSPNTKARRDAVPRRPGIPGKEKKAKSKSAYLRGSEGGMHKVSSAPSLVDPGLPLRISGAKKSRLLVTSKSYLLFTYLLPWGTNTTLDQLALTDLLLKHPAPAATLGLRSREGTFSVMLPAVAQAGGRWQVSSNFTALHTLAAVTFTKALLFLGNRNASSQLLSFFCGIVPESTTDFVEPSLPYLTSFWQDPMDDVMQSARTIFSSAIGRLPQDSLKAVAHSYTVQLRNTPRDGYMRENIITVLAILGAERPECLDPALTEEVTRTLLELLRQRDNLSLRVAAAELLSKGFPTWKPYVRDVRAMLHGFFTLCQHQDSAISTMAHHSLNLIGASEPRLFMEALTEMMARELSPRERADVLHILSGLIQQKPVAMLPELPRLTEMVVSTLDPNTPAVREQCLKQATTVLHHLVSIYPMVSFHTQQRLAVGTQQASIIIYDLRTGSKASILRPQKGGHTGPVTALAYSPDGNLLASYSLQEAKLFFWGHKSLPHSIAEFFGSGASPLRAFDVPPTTRNVSVATQLESVKLKWSSAKSLELIRAWEGSITVKL